MYRDSGDKIMYSRVTEEPSVEPIDRDAIADLQLKVDYSIDDALIDIKITAARQHVERVTGLSLITQTREIKLDYFPLEITLSNGPVQADSVVITYFDGDDVEQTLDSDEYWIDTHSRIARIVPKNTWPTTKCRPGAVTVEYYAGFGDVGSDVPAPLREACLSVLGWMYTNRDQPVPDDFIFPLVSNYVVVQDVSY